jgi:hypothetical protein
MTQKTYRFTMQLMMVISAILSVALIVILEAAK